MSADSSPRRPAQLVSERDSSGYEWEEVGLTGTPTDTENLLPPPPRAAAQEPGKQLCGYLHKQSQKGPLKVWKTRWFVFDDQNCCLYYSNHKNEPAQGKIDISTATLTYEVENLAKHQFEILSEGKSTSIQASSNEVMIYWLTTLQKKRKKFSVRRNKAILENTNPNTTSRSASGLISAEAPPIPEEEEPTDEAPLPVPVDMEDKSAYDGKTWIPKLRPPSFVTGSSPGSQRRPFSSINAHQPTAYQTTSRERSPEPAAGGDLSSPGHAVQSPPDTTSPVLRPVRHTGRNITNRLSVLMSRGVRAPKTESGSGCPNCQKAQETISCLETELAVKEREVKDRDDINEFLRSEIRLGEMREKVKKEMTTAVPLSPSSSNKVDVLVQREQIIQQLQAQLEEVIVARDNAVTALENKEKALKEASEQVELFKEAITAKDHVVVDLTNKLFQLENKGQVLNDPQVAMLPPTLHSLEQELKETKEALEAFKLQNQFLSSEIVELNGLRSEEVEAFRANCSKMQDIEAQLYKVESKYVILLKESQEPELDGITTQKQELVSQMLQEVLEGEGDANQLTKSRSDSYDTYGFSQKCAGIDKETVTDPLDVMAKKLDSQARSAQSAINETIVSQKAKWENYMSGGRAMARSAELKILIRNGIPPELRSKVWKWIIKDTLGKTYHEGEYQKVLREHAGQSSVAVNQIELDLLRTLPTNKYYDRPDAQGIEKLRRVLVAFSWYDANVGYCQGLNRLAAIALLFLEEEDAFWCLVAIVHRLLPEDYYSRTLLGSQTDQRVLKDLLQLRASRLSQHLSLCEIDFSLITFNWFHTVYVDNLPVETMLRIWDTFLYEGSKVLFRFALAIFKYNEERILEKTTSIGIFNHLRTMCQDSTDVERLVRFGFNEERNFSKKWIEAKRNFHRQQIKAELEKLDVQRAQATPPLRRTNRIQYEKTPDLISFDSRDDLLNGEGSPDSPDCKDGFLHIDSASDLEGEGEGEAEEELLAQVSDTPL